MLDDTSQKGPGKRRARRDEPELDRGKTLTGTRVFRSSSLDPCDEELWRVQTQHIPATGSYVENDVCQTRGPDLPPNSSEERGQISRVCQASRMSHCKYYSSEREEVNGGWRATSDESPQPRALTRGRIITQVVREKELSDQHAEVHGDLPPLPAYRRDFRWSLSMVLLARRDVDDFHDPAFGQPPASPWDLNSRGAKQQETRVVASRHRVLLPVNCPCRGQFITT